MARKKPHICNTKTGLFVTHSNGEGGLSEKELQL